MTLHTAIREDRLDLPFKIHWWLCGTRERRDQEQGGKEGSRSHVSSITETPPRV
jgi:hypothetical protein